eukprot:TRINITY_DN13931_c0_g10_i1.p1 TRINITY_DN13931_c0_g10~~TRINITY_DN13931_c0_g10_i1.p1  ORF type:complete len:792 (+),score=268.16 TRINITY_DN13931_c0_g10_i1:83-2458(+)
MLPRDDSYPAQSLVSLEDPGALRKELQRLTTEREERDAELAILWGKLDRAQDVVNYLRSTLLNELVVLRSKLLAKQTQRLLEADIASFFDTSLAFLGEQFAVSGSALADVTGAVVVPQDDDHAKGAAQVKRQVARLVSLELTKYRRMYQKDLQEREDSLRDQIAAKNRTLAALRAELDRFNADILGAALRKWRRELFDLRETCWYVRHTLYEFRRYLAKREVVTQVYDIVSKQQQYVRTLEKRLSFARGMVTDFDRHCRSAVQSDELLAADIADWALSAKPELPEPPPPDPEAQAAQSAAGRRGSARSRRRSSTPQQQVQIIGPAADVFTGSPDMKQQWQTEAAQLHRAWRMVHHLVGRWRGQYDRAEQLVKEKAALEEQVVTVEKERDFWKQQHELLKITMEQILADPFRHRKKKDKGKRGRKDRGYSRGGRSSRAMSTMSRSMSMASQAFTRHASSASGNTVRSVKSKRGKRKARSKSRSSRAQSCVSSAAPDEDDDTDGQSIHRGSTWVSGVGSRVGSDTQSSGGRTEHHDADTIADDQAPDAVPSSPAGHHEDLSGYHSREPGMVPPPRSPGDVVSAPAASSPRSPRSRAPSPRSPRGTEWNAQTALLAQQQQEAEEAQREADRLLKLDMLLEEAVRLRSTRCMRRALVQWLVRLDSRGRQTRRKVLVDKALRLRQAASEGERRARELAVLRRHEHALGLGERIQRLRHDFCADRTPRTARPASAGAPGYRMALSPAAHIPTPPLARPRTAAEASVPELRWIQRWRHKHTPYRSARPGPHSPPSKQK